ncbi:MAG: peptide chain release factor N(5)-glutamine methyltransferase [Pseudomonadales bacterium]|nr:peptide chain release factor N(5)-glutamine methyltransferase [Pseudomonadales bacterium]
MTKLSISQALQKSQLLIGKSASPELDVQLLLAEVLRQSTSYLYTWPERYLSAEQYGDFSALLQRRIQGEPVAYLLGYQDFWTLRLRVSEDTLIPRPDTELLVEQALLLLADGDFKVADLGTGTGAVALSLASERPSWKVWACDYIAAAAQLAELNREQHRLDNVQVVTGSWFEPLTGKFTLIVSNPPYIEAEDDHLTSGDLRFEPRSALVSGSDGLLDIAHIVSNSPEYLQLDGWLLLEHGYNQGPAVRKLFQQRGFNKVQTVQDLAANDRVTLGQWAAVTSLGERAC